MSEDKNKKLKNWIKVAMSLYVLAFAVGIGLNISNTVSKAEQLENTTVSSKKTVETTNTLENISKENIENTTESTKQEEKQVEDSSVEVIETVENTTESVKQEEKVIESNIPEVKQTEVSEVRQAKNTYTEEQTKQEVSSKIVEDVLETKYNASKFEEDHTEECALDVQMNKDTFCEGFYKLIAKTASEKALRAYMLDYGVWNYFGTDYDNNIITSNSLEVFLEDGSVITASGNKLYREINGSKKLFFDMDNYHNHSYTEGAYTVNNKGVIIGTTLDSNIKTLNIPSKISGKVVKGIDSGVFRNYNFTNVILPDSLEIIGYEQFYNSTFTEFKKPKNLKYVAYNIFNPKVNVTQK